MGKLKISYPAHRQSPVVRYGPGSLRAVAEAMAIDSTFFFLGSNPELRDQLEDALSRGGHVLSSEQVLVKPPGEPTLASIRDAASHFAGVVVDRLVAIGGGSVLDWARLAWLQSQGLLDGGAQDWSTATGIRPSIWLAPATCGTGAEAAGVAVYSERGKKYPVVSPLIMADQVILDARLLESLPSDRLASFVCDALSHGIEAFASIISNPFAEEASVSCLRLILENYPKRDELGGRQRLLEASYLGGVAASNCSVGVVHAFAHAMASYGIAHGVGNALGLSSGMCLNESAPQMQQLATRLQYPDQASLREAISGVAVDAIRTSEGANAVARLRDQASREMIADLMLEDIAIRSNPIPVSRDDALTFLDRVMGLTELSRA